MLKRLFGVVLLMICVSVTALAADWWEQEQTATPAPTQQIQSFQGNVPGQMAKTMVNWEDGYIEAVGMASVDTAKMKNKVQAELMATEGACAMAYAKLSESINGVAVIAHVNVSQMLTEDQFARTATQGIIKGARRIEERVSWDGAAPRGICRIGVVLRGEKGVQVPAYDYAIRNKVESKIPCFNRPSLRSPRKSIPASSSMRGDTISSPP